MPVRGALQLVVALSGSTVAVQGSSLPAALRKVTVAVGEVAPPAQLAVTLTVTPAEKGRPVSDTGEAVGLGLRVVAVVPPTKV